MRNKLYTGPVGVPSPFSSQRTLNTEFCRYLSLFDIIHVQNLDRKHDTKLQLLYHSRVMKDEKTSELK